MTEAGRVAALLPVEVLDAARADLADLRLVDPAGSEVAYALERTEPAATQVIPPAAFSTSVEDTATVFILRTGTSDVITALQIDAGQQSFFTRAVVEASDDGQSWRLLGRNLPVYDRGGQLRALRLDLPPGVYAHLRVSLERLGGRHVPLRGMVLVTRSTESAQPEPVGVRVTGREETPGETRLTLILAGANLQIATLELGTPEPVFQRPARLVSRAFEDETVREVTLATGVLSRTAGDRPATVVIPLAVERVVPARELILVVDNGDSPPLALTEVSAWQRPVRISFYAAAAGRFGLYVGNAKAAPPRYDVGTLAQDARRGEPLRWPSGALGANSEHVPGEALPEIPAVGTPFEVAPWSFRKPVRISAAGVEQLELDLEVLAHATHDLSDLRLASDGHQVPFVLERTSLTRTVRASATITPDPKQPRLSRWRLALPEAHLPLTRLTVVVPTPLFQREMRVYEEVEDDRGNPFRRELGEASWSQTPSRRAAAFSLALDQRPTTDALWLETDNGDNPPIALDEVRAHYSAVRLLFKTTAEAPVFLYYGNPPAGAPRYDLRLVGAQLLAAEKNAALLGAQEELKKPTFTGTIALAGRSGVLFWGMLVLVVIVLLAVIKSLLPKAPPADGPATPR